MKKNYYTQEELDFMATLPDLNEISLKTDKMITEGADFSEDDDYVDFKYPEDGVYAKPYSELDDRLEEIKNTKPEDFFTLEEIGWDLDSKK